MQSFCVFSQQEIKAITNGASAMHSLYLPSKNSHFYCLTIVCHNNLRFFKVQLCLCMSLYIRDRLGISLPYRNAKKQQQW